jgi:AraC-like DNA-binding protein
VKVLDGLSPVQRARALLDARVADRVGLDDLARDTGVSKFHLLRQFRRAFGMTPGQYQRHLRIEAAKRALSRGDSPSEVAFACGYVDQSHLTRAFRKSTGVTPGQYARATDCSEEGDRV